MVRYLQGTRVAVGARVDDAILATPYDDMLALVRDGETGLARVREAIERHEEIVPDRILAPLIPGKLLFHSINYQSIVDETRGAVTPTRSTFFSKLPSAVIGPGDAINKPYEDTHLDWEVELAVIIGRRCRTVRATDALAHVFGYTVTNDVSARDVQLERGDITLGKGFDTFCPIGPEIVLADEIPDPSRLTVSTYLNGQRVQHEATANMLFDVPRILEALSERVTLEPGDLVTTGSPAGLGMNRSPPRWLNPGDEIAVEVDRIGRLSNPVAAGW